MGDLLAWLGQLENSKTVALILFFSTFCGIILYAYTGKARRERLESYKNMPFDDEGDHSGEVKDNERN